MRRHIRKAARAQSKWAGEWVKGPYWTNRATLRSPEQKRLRELVRQRITDKVGIR